MSARIPQAVALISLLLMTPSGALAAWPHDPAVNVPACTAADYQNSPVTCSDGAGGAFIAWVDRRLGDDDIFAQHITASGAVASGWAANGLAVCITAGTQTWPVIAADGAGGAIIGWADLRNGNFDIYAQRVNGAGSNLWTSQGVQISTSTKSEESPRMVSDGAGGAIIVWKLIFSGTDYDVYANRVTSGGAIHSSWPSGGLSIVSSGFTETAADIASDGAGGAIVTWQGNNSGNFDIYAQRITDLGAISTGWPAGGAVLATATNHQLLPRIAPDGAGGAIAVWEDFRDGTGSNIYAQRVTAAGAISSGWNSDGVALCTASGDQLYPVLISDGGGGAIATWQDARGSSVDIYAHRITGSGTIALGWTSDGIAVCTAVNSQSDPTIASDGAGGAIVTWQDDRSGAVSDVFAQRITSAGTIAPGWTYNGSAISTAPSDQNLPVITSDLAGGAIIAWEDWRVGASTDIYCQRVEHFGQLGNPEPTMASVRDVAADQGGKVRLVWNASYLDADPLYGIAAYWIWRQVPATLAASAVARGATWLNDEMNAGATDGEPGPASLGRGLYCTTTSASGVLYSWEYLTSQPASGFGTYSYVATTTSDSMASFNPYTLFMVQARHVGDGAFWSSPADSGYSVDNLPPSAPSPFTGAYASGTTALHWGRNLEADLAAYRLYRGGSAAFVPSSSNLVVQKADTGYVDPGSAGSYYKLSAVDVHGNESPFALLTPAGTVSAGGEPQPAELAFGLASRNPVREEALFRLALPQEGSVSLVLYDASGRVIRQLLHGPTAAGVRAVRWDGRDSAGRVAPAGLYFARLRTLGREIGARLAVVR